MMKSIVWALAWEFSRQALWLRVLTVTGLVCMMKFILVVVVWQGGGYVDSTQADGSLNVFFVLAPFAYMAVIVFPLFEKRAGWGLPLRLYSLPIPTWFLTGWLMFLCMAANALAMLAMIGLFYLWTGISLLMWGPVVFAAVVAAWGLAILWAAAGSITLRLISFSAGVGLLVDWSGTRFDGGTMPWGGDPWTYPTAGEWFLMSSCVVVAYLISWYGVSRDRRGDVRSRPIEFEWWEQRGDRRLTRRESAYSSPEAAQFWYIWKLWGWVMPALAVSLIAFVLVFYWFDEPVDTILMIEGLGYIALTFGAFIFGILITRSVAFNRKNQVPPFLGTKPITDRSLAYSALKTASLSCLLTWIVFYLASLGSTNFFRMQGDLAGSETFWSSFFLEAGVLDWWRLVIFVGYSLVVVWTSTGIGVSLTLCGRPIVFGAMFLAFLTFTLGIGVLDYYGFHGFTRLVESAGPWLVFALCFGGTAWLFIGARRLGFIGTNAIGVAFLWLVFVSVMGVHEISTSPWNPPLSELLYIAGLFALPLTPFAAAPLALYWNRHR